MIKKEAITYGLAFVKTLTLKKIYNSCLLRLSYFFSVLLKRQMHWGVIESLSIEPTNLCNLACPECPSGNNSMTRQRLFLSENQFKNTIDKVCRNLVYFQLYFQGEPFMHPKMTDFIEYAVNKNIFTSTATNGHFLTPENCIKIVDSKLHQIIVSIDGTTQETFEKYRVGGSLDKVVSGIINLQKAKKKKQKTLPHIVIQFVVFSNNEHEIPEIKKLAKELKVTDLRLKSAQIDDYKQGNTLIPRNHRFSRYKKKDENIYILKRRKNFKCFRIWNGAVISAEGSLLPCCFDKNANYAYTTYPNLDIDKQWKNEKANLFRQNVWKSTSSYDICENCTEGMKKTWFR